MVVSYIPCLKELIDSHVLLDDTFTLIMAMYLHKDVSKGPDSTQYTSVDPRKAHVDVIDDIINTQCFSPSEACWGILGFEIMRKFPTFRSLTLHRPG